MSGDEEETEPVEEPEVAPPATVTLEVQDVVVVVDAEIEDD